MLRMRFRYAVDIIKEAHKAIKKDKYIHVNLKQSEGCYDDNHCIIRGGLGEGRPMINESQVWFNGDGKKNMDHETFNIKWYDKSNPNGFGFCKTSRKPYDLLVCVSLLAFKHAFDDNRVFTFSSDGDNSDWQTAKDVFTRITGSYVGEIFPDAELEVA